MVEMAPQGDSNYAMGFAGDTFNTAWYLRRALSNAWEISYLTGVGTDAMSDKMVSFIQGAGITPQCHVVPDRTVGLYMISLQNGERSFSYWRSVSAARLLAQHSAPIDALQAGDVAYFSGITVAILDSSDRVTLLQNLNNARARGVIVAFDPNLRPRLWTNTNEMREWIMRAAAVADIALPSFEDEASIFGDADKPATLKRYQDAGATCVVVKDGPGSVLAQASEGSTCEVSPQVHASPIDTTAAGDSFNAGFLAAHLAGDDLATAIAKGCAVSHQVVSHKGALVAVET